MKKIGIIGSGIVGQTLAVGFIKHSYEVTIGTSNSKKLEEWQSNEGKNVSIKSFAETAASSNTLVLAVKGTVAKEVVETIGASNLKGKTILDATNPISDEEPENGVIKFFTNINKSLMEELQETAPQANFVKAFSCIGSHFMIHPQFESKPSMFICGNNDEAKKEVSEINTLFGFETEDMGTVEAARAIEPLCMLWCIPGFRNNNWSHAFKLLKL